MMLFSPWVGPRFFPPPSAPVQSPEVMKILLPRCSPLEISPESPKRGACPHLMPQVLSTHPQGPAAPRPIPQLTMIQSGEGTWDRVWELSDVTEGTPAHHSSEKSQGALTV